MELNFATTTMPTILLWVIGLAVFALGGFIGYLNFNIDARKKMESADEKMEAVRVEAERRIKEAGKKLEEAKQLSSQVSAKPSLLQVYTNENRVMVEMDGKPLSGALNADEKKRLIELISYMRPFIEGKPMTPQTPPAQPMPVSAPQPATNLLTPQPVNKKTDAEKPFAMMSIVQQIDSVLQKNLLGTPFERQGIRLQESLQAAVEVYVGVQKYETIDDVKDEAIKKLIRASVAEWEEKYAPGPK